MKNIILITLICFITTMLFAQNVDVIIKAEPRCDIPNNKHIVDILMQKGDTPDDVNLSTQSYRFSYNTLALSNPSILTAGSDLDFGNVATSNNDSNNSTFNNPTLTGSAPGEISLNIDLADDTDGYYLSTSEIYVCSIEFDIVDGTESINIDWHEKIQHPATLIASKNNNQVTIVVQEFDDTMVNFCANCAGDCIEPAIKVFLESGYDTNTGQHVDWWSVDDKGLYGRGLLPGMTNKGLGTSPPAGQPYNVVPWNYAGTEGANFNDASYSSSDLDWVLVSLRSGIAKNTEVSRVAALLQLNGSIKFVEPVVINTSPVYIVIEHRNHIPVMSPAPVAITNGTLVFDFTAQDSYRIASTTGQTEVAPGIWAAVGGNSFQFGGGEAFPQLDVIGSDKTIWTLQNGVFDFYRSADYNFDGDVNGGDKPFWEKSNGKFSGVPQ